MCKTKYVQCLMSWRVEIKAIGHNNEGYEGYS